MATKRKFIMRYACLIYFDPKKVFDQSPEAEEVLRDSMDPNSEVRTGGHIVTEGPLSLPEHAMTLQVRDGKMSTTDGPFMETKEVLAGFYIIEADGIDAAAEMAATNPMAKLGAVEVRPLVDFSRPRPVL